MKKVKQILALGGVVLMAAMYVVTLILGLTASPATQGMLMASLACTIIIPILLYAIMLIARVLGGRDSKEDEQQRKTSGKK